MLNNC